MTKVKLKIMGKEVILHASYYPFPYPLCFITIFPFLFPPPDLPFPSPSSFRSLSFFLLFPSFFLSFSLFPFHFLVTSFLFPFASPCPFPSFSLSLLNFPLFVLPFPCPDFASLPHFLSSLSFTYPFVSFPFPPFLSSLV